MANHKLSHDQEIHEMKVKAQLEDNLRRKELDDRVRLLQAAKDDLVMDNNKLNAKLTDLQQKSASQTLEIETLKRNNDSLRSVRSSFLSFLVLILFFFYFCLISGGLESSRQRNGVVGESRKAQDRLWEANKNDSERDRSMRWVQGKDYRLGTRK